MKDRYNLIGVLLIFTNPLCYVYLILELLYLAVKYLLDITGITDWHFALFRLKYEGNSFKEAFLYVQKERAFKLFWLKAKAWQYTEKLILRELNNKKQVEYGKTN